MTHPTILTRRRESQFMSNTCVARISRASHGPTHRCGEELFRKHVPAVPRRASPGGIATLPRALCFLNHCTTLRDLQCLEIKKHLQEISQPKTSQTSWAEIASGMHCGSDPFAAVKVSGNKIVRNHLREPYANATLMWGKFGKHLVERNFLNGCMVWLEAYQVRRC